MVIMKDLKYQGKIPKSFEEVTKAELTMYSNEKEILHKNIENRTRKKYELNEMLSRIVEKDLLTTKILEDNIENIEIKIIIFNKEKVHNKIMKLEVSKEI